MILWNIWKQLNEKVFNEQDPDPYVIILTIKSQSSKYMAASSNMIESNPGTSNIAPIHWFIIWKSTQMVHSPIFSLNSELTLFIGIIFIGFHWYNELNEVYLNFYDWSTSIEKSCAISSWSWLAMKKLCLKQILCCLNRMLTRVERTLINGNVVALFMKFWSFLVPQLGFLFLFTPREGSYAADHLATADQNGWVHTPLPLFSHLLAIDVKNLNDLQESSSDPPPPVADDTSDLKFFYLLLPRCTILE